MSFNAPETVHDIPGVNCYTYIVGLKIVLNTMALVGTFVMEGNKWFAPVETLQRHLATADLYVLKHTIGRRALPDTAVLDTLRQIDESIRSEWARLVCSNEPANLSLGDIVQASGAHAAGLWVYRPPQEPAGGTATRRNRSGLRNRTRNSAPPRTPGFQQRDRRSRQEGARRLAEQQRSINDIASHGIKTCKTHEGRAFCKAWNDPRGCTNSACPSVHRCEVMLPSGDVCACHDHKRTNHRGPTVPS